MKKIRNYTYWMLLPALMAVFFLFTGGLITSPMGAGITDEYTVTAPTINSLNMTPLSASNNTGVTFTANVTANSINNWTEKDCKDKETSGETNETAKDLFSAITILKNGITVQSGSFTATDDDEITSDFTHEYTFMSPGQYQIIATFTSKYGHTEEKSSSETLNIVIQDDGTYLPGTYKLTTFSARCSGGSPMEINSGLQNNTIVIGEYGQTTLTVQVSFTAAQQASAPCIGTGYTFSGSGQIQISEKNGQHAFQIFYNAYTYLQYDYSFNGSELFLDYTDDNGSQYAFVFTKQ